MDKKNLAASAVFGQMVWLYMQSPMHREWAIKSMHQWLLPPLMHNQYEIYYEEGSQKPIGLVTWAHLSGAAEQAYVRNTNSLRPSDWKSGQRNWVMDFIAPFGNAKDIISDLKHNVFPNDVGRFLRANKNDRTMRIMYVHGVNALGKSRDRKANPTVFKDIRSEEGQWPAC